MNLTSIIMKAKGYTKVGLRDTKGVLDKTNNYKWVKIKSDAAEDATMSKITEVLPSGTKVEKEQYFVQSKKNKNNISRYVQKTITKPDGTTGVYTNGKFITFNTKTGEAKIIRR